MTWKKKSGNKRLAISHLPNPNLPFDTQQDDINESNIHPPNSNSQKPEPNKSPNDSNLSDVALADDFLKQGNKFAEDGKYREALGKWEAAIILMPEKAVLHEQKAQVLLEIGDAWGALKAATRATELDPSWAEAWTTLGRAQLNYGEPDAAVENFDKALAIKPELVEARGDRQTSLQLVKKRKQLHSLGVSMNRSRYVVGDGTESNFQS